MAQRVDVGPPEAWLDAPSPNALAGPVAAATRMATIDVEAAITAAHSGGGGHRTESWQRP